MEKLKPCPFCGSAMIGLASVEFGETQAFCDNCGAKTESYMSVKNAVDAWNRRASDVETHNA